MEANNVHDPPLPVRTREALHGLIPPSDYTEPAAPSPPLGAFGLLLDESTPGVIGRVLGSGTPIAAARWHHLAGDAAACEAIKTSVVLHHIAPLPEWEATTDPQERTDLANRMGGQFCARSGSNALLVHGKPGWEVCVLLARHLAQRDGEADDEYASRCRLHHAWATTHAFKKAGVILLILRQAAALLGGADLFKGMVPYSLAGLPPDALEAHLRVPSRLRLQGCALAGLIDPVWRSEEAEDVSAEEQVLSEAEAEQLNEGGAAAQPSRQSVGADTVATAADDGASDSERSVASTHAASKAPAHAADDKAWAAYQLAEAVRCIVGRDPQTTLDEMCERLDALGLRADREQVEEARSKAKRARAERLEAEAEAMNDAVEAFDSNMGAWMRANGVSNPSAKEAARLRVLSDRLAEQRQNGDFEGAVATWLETKLGSGIRPTRNERNNATRKMQAFFAEDGSPTMQQRGGRGQGAAVRRVRRGR